MYFRNVGIHICLLHNFCIKVQAKSKKCTNMHKMQHILLQESAISFCTSNESATNAPVPTTDTHFISIRNSSEVFAVKEQFCILNESTMHN